MKHGCLNWGDWLCSSVSSVCQQAKEQHPEFLHCPEPKDDSLCNADGSCCLWRTAFSMSYDQELCNFTFLHTTVYGIDVGSVKESPRVKEIRARIHHSAVWGGTHLGLCSLVKTARYPAQLHCYLNIKFQHCFYPGKSLCLNCGEPGCSFVFCTYSGYKHHLSRAHGDSIDSHPVRHFEFEPAANVVVGPSVSSKCGSSCDCQYTQSSWY